MLLPHTIPKVTIQYNTIQYSLCICAISIKLFNVKVMLNWKHYTAPPPTWPPDTMYTSNLKAIDRDHEAAFYSLKMILNFYCTDLVHNLNELLNSTQRRCLTHFSLSFPLATCCLPPIRLSSLFSLSRLIFCYKHTQNFN